MSSDLDRALVFERATAIAERWWGVHTSEDAATGEITYGAVHRTAGADIVWLTDTVRNLVVAVEAALQGEAHWREQAARQALQNGRLRRAAAVLHDQTLVTTAADEIAALRDVLATPVAVEELTKDEWSLTPASGHELIVHPNLLQQVTVTMVHDDGQHQTVSLTTDEVRMLIALLGQVLRQLAG